MDHCAPGYQGTLHVRLAHALVRRRVASLSEWHVAEDGVPVNQCDMQATHLAFSVIFLLGSRVMGVRLSPDEGAAVMHLWRYIGWLMGVDDRWLAATEREGRIALYQNLLSQAGPDETSRRLGRALRDEPLAHHYPNARWLRGHWNRAKHLSMVRAFVGARGMEALGLPKYVLPWYPLLTAPPRFVMHRAARLVPFGRDQLSCRGLDAQQRYMSILSPPNSAAG